jgi:hypothetical protein
MVALGDALNGLIGLFTGRAAVKIAGQQIVIWRTIVSRGIFGWLPLGSRGISGLSSRYLVEVPDGILNSLVGSQV